MIMLKTNNMNTFRKEIIGDELYLYDAKGELIFKRWIKQNRSVVFTPWPYGKDTLVSITDEGRKVNAK